MTQSMENSLDQPKQNRDPAVKKNAPTEPENPNDSSKAHLQSRTTPYEHATRSDLVQPYQDTHTYVTRGGNYGPQSSALNMANMISVLPCYQRFEQHSTQHHFIPATQSPGPMYNVHQFQSFPGTAANTNMYAPFPQMYMPYVQQQQLQDSRIHEPPRFQAVHNQLSPLGSVTTGQSGGYYDNNPYGTSHGHRQGVTNSPISTQRHNQSYTTAATTTADLEKEAQKRHLNLEYDVSKTIVDGSTHMRPAAFQSLSADLNSHPPHTAKPITPRGPPRKPKQSGHALWVGNLAPGTEIVELKDYFSQDATKDLESVFLISKSNCAFVNYKTEAACLAALARFHDTRFRGARLVCRVRRGLVTPGTNSDMPGTSLSPSLKEGDEFPVVKREDESSGGGGRAHSKVRVPNRYFIVKSLTIEDLEMSRQSGIWATQTHNEDNLNEAYETADNVYLIFSANKSGEYYGYARMMSPIRDDESLTLVMPLRPDPLFAEPEDLNVTPTPATSTAPNGRIISDTARGTIFWEADTSSEDEDSNTDDQKGVDQAIEDPLEGGLQLIGKPFRIRWLSTERVPFHRTRGLRNPWNANREVKIARDGTELEPSVGEKLVMLFYPEASGQSISTE